jgi:hypothetical protein
MVPILEMGALKKSSLFLGGVLLRPHIPSQIIVNRLLFPRLQGSFQNPAPFYRS